MKSWLSDIWLEITCNDDAKLGLIFVVTIVLLAIGASDF